MSRYSKPVNAIKSSLTWGDKHWDRASQIVEQMATKTPRKGQEKSFNQAIERFRGAISGRDQSSMENMMRQVTSAKKSKMMSGGQLQKDYLERLQKL